MFKTNKLCKGKFSLYFGIKIANKKCSKGRENKIKKEVLLKAKPMAKAQEIILPPPPRRGEAKRGERAMMRRKNRQIKINWYNISMQVNKVACLLQAGRPDFPATISYPWLSPLLHPQEIGPPYKKSNIKY
jgi:hypothetical protein